MNVVDLVNKSKYLRLNTRFMVSSLKPDFFYRTSLPFVLNQINNYDYEEINARVNYCNKLDNSFKLDAPVSLNTFKHKGNSQMKIDLKMVLRYFEKYNYFKYVFGDVKRVPEQPSFLKSRPIAGDNKNSVLLKLNSARHFNFVNDPLPYKSKLNSAVWRGAVYYNIKRKELVNSYYNHEKCNIGDTDKDMFGQPTYAPFMSFSEQLRYKFIISIEGNDVATNLKWIMSSNSLCFMPKPKYETWFMEGRLQAGVHYVELKDDFSDLEEKIDYYSCHDDEAMEIINNANIYVSKFRDRKKELLISLLVAKKYFELCLNNNC